MKTERNFYTDRTHLHTTRPKSSHFSLVKKTEGMKSQMRERIKTMVNFADTQHCKSYSERVVQSDKKVLNRFDTYDEESEFLTTEFATDWAKMDLQKKETYHKLRNQFVRKFPIYRQKYKTEELEDEKQSSLRSDSLHTSLNGTKSHGYVKNIDKKAIFYSRSKKKCMVNTVEEKEVQEKQVAVPMPKLSFMTYMRKFDERRKFKIQRVKGIDLIENKEKILNLEKEGTKFYESVKRCL